MICPKCRSAMMTVNRGGVRLEQCEGCRGIFLDRGELEHILDAEQRHYGGMTGGMFGGRPDSPPAYRSHASHGGHYRDSPPPYGHRRRKSFLEQLFD